MHQEIKDRIIQLLSEVVERSKAIDQSGGSPINLEIDLIMEDLRLLYRDFEWLRKHIPVTEDFPVSQAVELPKQELIDPSDLAKPAEQKAQVILEKISTTEEVSPVEKSHRIVDDEKEELRPAVPDPVIAVSPAAMAVNIETNLKEQAVTAGMETQIPVASSQSIPAPDRIPSIPQPPANIGSPGITKTRIADRFVSEDNSLHKRLAAQKEDRSLGARLQMTPISNLKDAIGVNEKFLFINELFGGNIQVYNEAIAKLNAFQNIDQAFDYLNDLGKTLDWDESRSAQTIEKLAGFVMRRYLVR